jgi:hypothetical protein
MGLLKKNKEIDMTEIAKRVKKNLEDIYSNKSSDEYKCRGDITKSPQYDTIETSISYLSSIKRYPEKEAKELKECFLTLHRPLFAKNVAEYMNTPTEKNTVYALAFTTGYRLLIGELARVISSTEATDNGLVYKPDKISRKENSAFIIRLYNKDIDKTLDKMVKYSNKKLSAPIQESALGAVGDVANSIVLVIEGVFGFLGNIFSSAKALNPVALISAILSRSYDKKIEKFSKISKEYDAAKKAYDEYKKIPATQRKKRIEHKYVKMIEKYNIKMQNLKAQIDHYDLRARDEANEKSSTSSKSNNSDNDKLPSSSSTVDTTSTKTHEDFDF